MHSASQIESRVPKLSPVLAGLTLLPLPGLSCSEWQDSGSWLLAVH